MSVGGTNFLLTPRCSGPFSKSTSMCSSSSKGESLRGILHSFNDGFLDVVGFEVFLENFHGLFVSLVFSQRYPVIHLNLPPVLAPFFLQEFIILVGEGLLVILSRS